MTIANTVKNLGEIVGIHDVVPSPLNPRKHIDEGRLKELQASIESKGIIEPLIVRSRPGLGQLEIVAGERRYRAGRAAGLTELPVIVRTLSDVEVLELMAIENSQRDDLHPLEEAEGYAALMKADAAYTPKAIAAKIGKSERYVQQRLQLGRLDSGVKLEFLANHITAGHADLISRLTPDAQKRALKVCFENLYGEDRERGCISVRELNQWIDANIRLDLTATNPQTEFFPELEKVLEHQDDAVKILQVAGSYVPPTQHEKLLGSAVPSEAYRTINGKKDRCKHAQCAVVVIGHGRGQLTDVCTARTECKVHWKYEIETAERRARENQAKSKGVKNPRAKADRAADQRATAQQAKMRAQEALHASVLEQAIKEAKKNASTSATPGLLKLLAFLGHGSTWREIAIDSLDAARFDLRPRYKDAHALLKGFGVDVAAIERRLATESAPAKDAKKKGQAA